MRENEGLSSFVFLEQSFTDALRNECLSLLDKMEFKGYDYGDETYIPFNEALKKYPDRKRYMLKYNDEPFGVSCAVDDCFFLFRAGTQSKDSRYIVKVVNAYALMLKAFSFSYIDFEGDPPKKIENIIKIKGIEWLFKYNYFGKNYIEKYGKDFFTNMPCVKHEFITDDIIRIDLVKDIFDEVDEKLKEEINNYLQKHSLKVRFYDYRQRYID